MALRMTFPGNRAEAHACARECACARVNSQNSFSHFRAICPMAHLSLDVHSTCGTTSLKPILFPSKSARFLRKPSVRLPGYPNQKMGVRLSPSFSFAPGPSPLGRQAFLVLTYTYPLRSLCRSPFWRHHHVAGHHSLLTWTAAGGLRLGPHIHSPRAI